MSARDKTNHARSINTILAYHARTKHHLNRFAESAGYLDWESQPDPFRRFTGSEKVPLPLLRQTPGPSYDDLHVPDRVSPAPLDLNGVGTLFELALGLSAWKKYGDTRWALRSNPSSGNLHPTEGYAIHPRMTGVETPGVYHYLSHDHCLELRCALDALSGVPEGSLLVGLSSIHWREAWKYGERAFRYCQHDTGHAIAAVRYAGAVLGWSVHLLAGATDPEIVDTLGLTDAGSFRNVAREDREHPGALLLVGPRTSRPDVDLAQLRKTLAGRVWTGRANSLSPNHVAWPVIDEAAEATWKTNDHDEAGTTVSGIPSHLRPTSHRDAASIIRHRRSAVSFDDQTWIESDTFYRMLDRLLPRAGVPPWDVWPWRPHVHCAIFVHRVRDLEPGLYLFERSVEADSELRSALKPEFHFERPDTCPAHIALFRLTSGDFRETAQLVSCRQKIASSGAFSLGMLAEFASAIHSIGAWWYRRLFWEAGLLGHVLYLEAEAAGIRSTGIGCYFDDVFHDILGIQDSRLQSLYHFTVGRPVEDTRLTTEPGYDHLEISRRNPDRPARV